MNAQVERWLAHIRALAVDIGSHGPITEGERRGAEYCATVLRQLGLAPPGGAVQQRAFDL